MMKRFLFSCLLALVSATAMWAENYPIMIGGVQLTSDNYQNITAAGGFSAVKSGAGTVTYDPATMTLTLSNAVIEATGTNYGIYFTDENNTYTYTLVLAEGTTSTVTATIVTALQDMSALTIKGGGAGTFTSSSANGIGKIVTNDNPLTIRDCSVTATGKESGICGYYSGGTGPGPLMINNATVRATGTSRGSIWYFSSMTLTDAAIVSPEGAEWNGTAGAVCMPGSNSFIKTEVVIEPTSETVVNAPELNPLRYDVDKDGDLSLSDLTLLANALVGRVNYPATGLSMSPPTAKLYTNGTLSPTVSITPSTADITNVAWTTSNKYVATVSADGLVTALSPGSCTITAATIDGSGLTASCEVTVVEFTLGASDYVDLGLPSGTLWATCNIGASSPEDYGDYFAWGETLGHDGGKTTFTWETYSHCEGTDHTLTKYCFKSDYGYNGYTDTLTELEPTDDAAYVNWGSEWRMPSKAQFAELFNSSYTTTTKTTVNGKEGWLITSLMPGYEDVSIFLPLAGNYSTKLNVDGQVGYYWTRSLAYMTNYPIYADVGYMRLSASTNNNGRCYGCSVRPVRNQ